MKNTIYYQMSISTVNTQSAPLGSWNASTDSNAIRNAPAISAVYGAMITEQYPANEAQ
jgi:hypothetical protein